ncbi:MAG: internal scaffolding protein [Microviridae sp.]|nr:MAG: internal scaffolding protein [Microviridae sp.]
MSNTHTFSFNGRTVRNAYTGKVFPEESSFQCFKPSRTKQSFKDECDINKIMAQFQTSGVLEFTTRHEPQYGDVTGLDFVQAMNTVATARDMFQAMPAHLRERFANNPANFLDFVQDPENRLEAERLGLVQKKQPQQATQTGAGAPLTSSTIPTP